MGLVELAVRFSYKNELGCFSLPPSADEDCDGSFLCRGNWQCCEDVKKIKLLNMLRGQAVLELEFSEVKIFGTFVQGFNAALEINGPLNIFAALLSLRCSTKNGAPGKSPSQAIS